MVKKCCLHVLPGYGTSVATTHVRELWTRHAHTGNWGEYYEYYSQLHVMFSTDTTCAPYIFFLSLLFSKKSIGRFAIIFFFLELLYSDLERLVIIAEASPAGNRQH